MAVQAQILGKKNLSTIGTSLISVLVPGSVLSVSGNQEKESKFQTNPSPISTEKCTRWLSYTHRTPPGPHAIQDCLGYKNHKSPNNHMASISLVDFAVSQENPRTTSIKSGLTTDTTREW